MSAGLLLVFLFLLSGPCTRGYSRNVTSRPTVVNIGAIFTFDSTIGRVAKIAIEQAVKDVNANSSFLRGTKLLIKMQNSNCSGFVGMVQGTSPSASNLSVHFGYGVVCFALYHGHGQTPTWVLVVVFLTALKLMETDIVAILGPQSSVVAHMISHVANELQTPLLTFAATDPTLNSLQFPFFVRTTQSDLYQMAAISEIVDHYGWKQVIAIYIDDDFGRNGVSSLNDQLAAKRCRISYKVGIPPLFAANQSSIMDVLVNIALMESRVVVLHVNADIGFKVFSVAKHIGMMGNGYVWIATDWLSSVLDSNSHLPSDTMDTMQGVIALRQHTPDSNRKKAFISKWNKLTGGSLGLNSYGLYVYDSVWLVAHAINAFFDQGGIISFSSDPKLQASQGGSLHLEAMGIFDDGPLLLKNILQSDFVGLTGQVKFDSDRSLIRPAYDVLNVIGSGSRRVGYWSNYSGLSTVPPETLYSKPPNRSSTNRQLYSVIWPGETSSKPRGWVFPNNGKQLRIGVPIRVSFREFVSHVQGTDTFNGFSIDVFTAAVNLLPYAVPYRFVPFGDGKKNPSYTELVNLVTAGVFDAAVGDIAIVTNRTKIADFTQPYASSGLVVVASFRKLNSGAWAFLHPFSARMWIITSFSFIVVGIVVWILEHRINDEFRGPPKRQIITVLWFSLSTLFFAHKETTMSTLGRMVLIIWLFVVLIINSSYTASLTSILTVQQLSSPVKGLESLKKGDDPIGYQVGSFAEYYLSEEIGIPKSRLRSLGSPEEYARALKDGPKNGGVVAVVDERPYIELFLSSQCSFRIVGQEFTKSGWGFAFPRDSPLAVDLSTAILELSENGELQRIHDKWLIGRTCGSETSEIDSNRLQLKSFWGLFLICGLVCFIALFIYFCKIFRKIYQSDDVESVHSASGSQRHGHLKRIISLMDEKKDESKHKNKKRKMESSISADDSGLYEASTGSNRRQQTEMATGDQIISSH